MISSTYTLSLPTICVYESTNTCVHTYTKRLIHLCIICAYIKMSVCVCVCVCVCMCVCTYDQK